MRGAVLSLCLIAAIGFNTESEAEVVCMPGPAAACVDLMFVQWAMGDAGEAWGHPFVYYHGTLSGFASLSPETPRLVFAFEQVVLGDNVLCTSATPPHDAASGQGPLNCAVTFRLEHHEIGPDGSWTRSYPFRFFTGSAPNSRGPIGSPENPEGTPRVLGLAVYDPEAEWSEPRATCGSGFFGPWAELSVGDCVGSQNVVPEPSTVILLATGLFGIGLVAWRRKEEN